MRHGETKPPRLSCGTVPTLDWLPDPQARAVDAVAEAVARGAGEKLIAVALVGSWVPPVRPTVAERPELLVVLQELPLFVLGNLAHQVRQASETEGVRVVVMTERELLRATDVFTLELADYAARHHLVAGRDPLGDLHFTSGELRLAIERRLRFLARDIRETMLTGTWQKGRLRDVGSVLRDGFEQLFVVAHHLAVLDGVPPADDEAGLVAALAARASLEPEALLETLRRLGEAERFPRPVESLGELLELVDGATGVVDAMGVAAD